MNPVVTTMKELPVTERPYEKCAAVGFEHGVITGERNKASVTRVTLVYVKCPEILILAY